MTEGRPGALVRIATCGKIGYFPFAPGTAGSAVGLALVTAVGRLPLSRPWIFASLAVLAAGILVLGARAADRAEKFFQRPDPSQVVIDEVVGQMISFLAWPDAAWRWLLTGFILFRIFDVIKPFPARQAERVPGGWGIMLDDVFAGGYSLALLLALRSVLK